MSGSILCCMHQDYMEKVVSSIREEFKLPVVCIVMWQFVENQMTLSSMEKDNIGKFYSMPQFYFDNINRISGMKLDDLDSLQKTLEEELSINNNVMITYYDRMFYQIEDYRESRNLQVIYLLFAKKIFDENEIRYILLGRELYLWQILADIGLSRRIPAMGIAPTRHVGHRLFAYDSKNRQQGMEQIFNALMKEGTKDFDAKDIADADEWYERFINKPQIPRYVEHRSRSLLKNIKSVPRSMSFIKKNVEMYRNNEFDRNAGRLDSSVDSMLKWPRKALRMFRLEYTDFLVRKPDFSKKYIYLPLHKSPEVNDMYFGEEYSHHESFVFQLAKKLPSDYCLYVKDHTAMVGDRELGFYKRLKALYNVEVIHPYVSTFELSKNSAATLTVTGTAGWEAYLLNRPVVVLGRVFYNFLPNLLYADLYSPDFTERLLEYLDNFSEDPKGAQNALRAHFLASYKTSFSTREMDDLGAKAQDYARIPHNLFRKWGELLLESEPKACRGEQRTE
ncbi:hypothetical protein [Pseudodesulfovibrio cashew]|nr:hypothetical protein [Pseudodesulfovibrio cashew]